MLQAQFRGIELQILRSTTSLALNRLRPEQLEPAVTGALTGVTPVARLPTPLERR